MKYKPKQKYTTNYCKNEVQVKYITDLSTKIYITDGYREKLLQAQTTSQMP